MLKLRSSQLTLATLLPLLVIGYVPAVAAMDSDQASDLRSKGVIKTPAQPSLISTPAERLTLELQNRRNDDSRRTMCQVFGTC